jgi:hypothetical protein
MPQARLAARTVSRLTIPPGALRDRLRHAARGGDNAVPTAESECSGCDPCLASRSVSLCRRRSSLGLWARQARGASKSKKLGIRRAIVWVSHPKMHDVLDHMNEMLSVYHIVGEYRGYTGVGRTARS